MSNDERTPEHWSCLKTRMFPVPGNTSCRCDTPSRSRSKLASMKSKKIALVVLAAAIVMGGLWLRHYLSPAAAVKRKLAATVEAFEEERMLAAMSGISRAYSDEWGLSYETLGGYLHETIDTYDDLDLDLIITEVEARETEARVGVRFVLWGKYQGSRGYVVGSFTEPCTAVLVWRKETPGWRFASTEDLVIPELTGQLETMRDGR